MSRKDIRTKAKESASGHWTLIIITSIVISILYSIGNSANYNMASIVSSMNQGLNDDILSTVSAGRSVTLIGVLTTFISYVLMGGLHLGVVQMTKGKKVTFGDIIDIMGDYLLPISIVAAIVTALDTILLNVPFVGLIIKVGFIIVYPFFFMEIENIKDNKLDDKNLGEFFKRVFIVPGKVRINLLIHGMYLLLLPSILYFGLLFLLGVKMAGGENFMLPLILMGVSGILYIVVYLRNGALFELVRGVEYELKDIDTSVYEISDEN